MYVLLASGIVLCNSAHTHDHHHQNHTNTTWIVDTEAIDQMICNLHFFTHNITKVSHTVELPNGATCTATHMGDVHLPKYLVLHKVLYVPAFSFSLISVRSLTNHSNSSLMFFSLLLLYLRPLDLDDDRSGEGA